MYVYSSHIRILITLLLRRPSTLTDQKTVKLKAMTENALEKNCGDLALFYNENKAFLKEIEVTNSPSKSSSKFVKRHVRSPNSIKLFHES